MQLTGVTQYILSAQCYGDQDLGQAFKVSHSQQFHFNSISKQVFIIYFTEKMYYQILLWMDPTQVTPQPLTAAVKEVSSIPAEHSSNT